MTKTNTVINAAGKFTRTLVTHPIVPLLVSVFRLKGWEVGRLGGWVLGEKMLLLDDDVGFQRQK